ncbi:MAG: 50S ribosomal protein L22 [Actinomycetota bacterium]|nr:50S ribosomal protein L22 [Actinomycetota bacterium]
MSSVATAPGTRAVLKNHHASASKVREVLDLIRGKDIISARDILVYTERGSARPVLKLLASAVANAENNDSIPADELYVSACWADEGITMKRFRPRARGRAGAIRKRTSHITIVVSRMESERLVEVSRKRSADESRRTARRAARVRRSLGDEAAEAPATEVEAVEVETVEAPQVETVETPEVEVVEVEAVEVEAVEVEAPQVETVETAEVVETTEVVEAEAPATEADAGDAPEAGGEDSEGSEKN